MEKSVNDYLRILFPKTESLDGSEIERYMHVSAFLEREFVYFEEEYNDHIRMLDRLDEEAYANLILEFCMEARDDFTKVTKYAGELLDYLSENSYISSNFEEFLKIMKFQRKQAEEMQNQPKDDTPIKYDDVLELTREFLTRMDPSGEMAREFDDLRYSGGIELQINGKSEYRDQKIRYNYDGTVASAHTLIHEFMHHWAEKKAPINKEREEHTMLFEYESIYYEKAFIQFMDEKGLLQKGPKPVEAERFKTEYERDPDNCIIMFLELANIKRQNGKICNQDIVDVMKKYHPLSKSDDEIWEEAIRMMSEFTEENYFTGETINGPIMYRFNHGLALKTPLSEEAVQSIHKLTPLLKDRDSDHIFMLEFFRTLERIKNSEKSNGHVPIEKIISTFGSKVDDGMFSLED